jgi:MoaA/NifB/PqqE/SkfB family radical SAM enzyme
MTRDCDLRCNYCKVWVKRRPRELNTKESKRLLEIVAEINPEILIFFGGEPTLRKDFDTLVKYANDLGIEYAIITNGFSKINYSICKNITCSIDIIPKKHIKGDKNIDLKSHRGYWTLLEAKDAGVPDVCGNMIIHKESYKYIPDLIKLLSIQDIWSIVGYVHSGSEPYWEFRNKCDNLLLNDKEIDWISNELYKLKQDPKIKLHNVKEYFIHMQEYAPALDWHCGGNIEYLAIDEDGTIMACPDYRGARCPNHNIFNLDLQQLQKDWEKDIVECKKGCYYNHMLQLRFSKREDKVLVH